MKILVYPTFNNPYQNLLYREVEKYPNVKVSYLDDGIYRDHFSLFILTLLPRLIYYRLKGYSIFHLHWQDFRFPFPSKQIGHILSTMYILLALFVIKILRYKLIWTVHNIVPHQQLYINDIWVTKLLVKSSDYLIVHSEHTINELLNNDIQVSKFKVIPLGNYIDIYPNTSSSEEARKYLNISLDDFVFLFFGKIRGYKGIEELITTFNSMSKDNKSSLIIAGECLDDSYKKALLDLIGNNNRIFPFLEHIPDEKIQYFFNAADITVLPFKKLTTSSSILLSFSFAKTCICPRLGSLCDIPADIALFYSGDLKERMEWAIINRVKIDQMSKKTYEFVKKLTWELSAEKTIDVYKKV